MRDRKPNPSNPNWVVIPFLDEWEMTKATLMDCLAMRVDGRRPNIMLVDNGSDPATTGQAVLFVHACFDLLDDVDVMLTGHPAPGQPLNHAWNIALWQIWEFGGEQVLVVNNDVQLHPDTFRRLGEVTFKTGGLLVSGVNAGHVPDELPEISLNATRGGPDFSCFLITREAHTKYPFDPRFTFAGDWDTHRRYLMGGDGDSIFGVNVPYLHVGQGSQTLKRMREKDPARAQQIADMADQHRALYAEKWGGTFGQETLDKPKWEVEF